MRMDYTDKQKQDVEVAGEILKQMGGQGRIKAMTGARGFAAIDNGVSFSFPKKSGMPKTNGVQITLNDMDTYDVRFLYFNKRTGLTLYKEFEGVYFDQLKGLFEETTGLYLSL